MRDMMRIYVVIIFLSEAWSLDPGTNESTSAYSNTSSTQPRKMDVEITAAFNDGSDANLTCNNKTWNETMYVIWEIRLKSRGCKISFSSDGQSQDFCKDGKSLRNASNGQLYLHIPNFSMADVGVYRCESAYTGGNDNYKIHVGIRVPPTTSAWLEHKDNKMVAVCRAERGIPAANISWSHTGNVRSNYTPNDPDGFSTVESYLEIPDGTDTENLTCTVKHPFWDLDKTLKFKKAADFPWLCVLIVVVIVVFLLGFLFFAQRKLTMLRRCKQADNSPSKFQTIEDVEEVEPYASYVQRVNSIYNSTADCSHKNPAHASQTHI